MKTLCRITVSLSLAGCATKLPVNYYESCALKGMTLDKVTSGTSDAVGASSRGAFVHAESSSEYVNCTVPKTEQEKCEMHRQQSIVQPKLEYNSGTSGDNWLITAGYVAILPGIALKVFYADHKYDKAMTKSEQIAKETETMCVGKADKPGPTEVRTPTSEAPN